MQVRDVRSHAQESEKMRRGDRVQVDLKANGGIVQMTGTIVAFGLGLDDATEGAIVRFHTSTGRKLPRPPGQSPSSKVGFFALPRLVRR